MAAAPLFEPVRFGILGCGRIASNAFAPALAATPHAVLQAAASRDRARALALAPVRAYEKYADLLEDPAVEAVYVATHNGLHRDLALAALEHGKHVLCEKPLGRDAAECAELLAAARRHDRHLVEAFMYRHHPQIALALRLVAAGTIGELKAVEAAFSFHLTRTDDVRLRHDWGGGALLDLGCYCINACRLFLGDEPLGVTARGAFHPEHQVDLAVHGVLEYAGGRFGVISCGFDSGLRNHVILSGTLGVLTLPHAFLSWPFDAKVVVETDAGRTEHAVAKTDVFGLEIDDLAAAVRTGRMPLLGPDEGLKNARILAALLAAARAVQ
ncbi:MAG TPA: Gfo/Idh/MocA family oxidoreductase [Planctomycetota bacterium]